jgi:hypothetical protein
MRTARGREKVPASGGALGGAAYRSRTDDLRITRGTRARHSSATCTNSMTDSAGNTDCTGNSWPFVPRPVPRDKQRETAAALGKLRPLAGDVPSSAAGEAGKSFRVAVTLLTAVQSEGPFRSRRRCLASQP